MISVAESSRVPLPEEDNPYLKKFGFQGRCVAPAPPRDLGMVVVIPCHDEPDLIGSLEALRACAPPDCQVECIVVVNDAENATDETRRRNLETLTAVNHWRQFNDTSSLRFHIIESLGQPAKRAGVGLARKIGMDEAVRRLDLSGNGDRGVIVCFDADCRCDNNYLREIERHFREHPGSPGCSIYFEHSLEQAPDRRQDAIVSYELHLRYYIDALRLAGFPRAYQTVGSSMAVRSWAYQKQGGMNLRQAGEDFYFLHRIIELGGFTELLSTRVLPSPRPSHRVPFGTGRAVAQMLEQKEARFTTYPFQSFLDLRQLLPLATSLRLMSEEEAGALMASLPSPLRKFLDAQRFASELIRMRNETTQAGTYFRRFFSWFNAFRVMKCVHHARDACYGSEPVAAAAAQLLRELDILEPRAPAPTERELLETFRSHDREGWQDPPSCP